MSLTVTEITITGTQEALIRDNVAHPESNLGERALKQLVDPYKMLTLERAKREYHAVHKDNPDAALPNYLNDDAVIAWYFARPDYKTATIRQNELRLAQINNELASLTSEKSRHQARLSQLSGESNEGLINSITATIDAIDNQIVALNAEKAEL